MLAVRIILVCSVVAACSDSGGTPIDAKQPDSPGASFVVTVTCPGTPAATVTTSDLDMTKYTPSAVSINQGQIVKFTMSSLHDVTPAATSSDPNLRVAKGQEKCFMFTQSGTYKFFCTPHGFAGMVTVN